MSVLDSKYIMKVHFQKITTYNLISNEKDKLNYFMYIAEFPWNFNLSLFSSKHN